MPTVPRSILLVVLLITAAASLLLAVSLGSASLSPGEALDSLLGKGDPLLAELVRELRLPRALAAFGTGAALAIAGVMMQVLLRNPLADPYILGTSGGAAAAALVAMTLGFSGLVLDAAAFAGALGSTLLVFGLTRAGDGWSSGRLLLTGVVTAAGWGAVITLLLALAPDTNLRGMLFWLMGDFSYVANPWPAVLAAGAAVIAGVALAKPLNLLSSGAAQAAIHGLEVQRVHIALYFISALLTAIAVTTAGTIGFVGLVIPHLIRLLSGSDHRIVVPCAALAGGSLLVLADLLARTAVAPRQLPVGAITAAIGVPLFLLLLRRSQSSQQ